MLIFPELRVLVACDASNNPQSSVFVALGLILPTCKNVSFGSACDDIGSTDRSMFCLSSLLVKTYAVAV
eukprot:1688680-Amphidinium_carterae.1